MRINAAAEAFLATLPPDRAAAARANVERARHLTDDECRRLAVLLGLRKTSPPEAAPRDPRTWPPPRPGEETGHVTR